MLAIVVVPAAVAELEDVTGTGTMVSVIGTMELEETPAAAEVLVVELPTGQLGTVEGHAVMVISSVET